MILRTLRFSSLGDSFAGKTVTMDFTALPAGVYALVGTNGAGKTTVLEAMMPGLLYRHFPSYRESVQQKATRRTAFLEGEFIAGDLQHWIVIQADPQAAGGRGKTEAYWYVEDGEGGWTPTAGPLLADFDRYRDSLFPSLELLLAGPFCAQKGRGSFFSATSGERKDLLVEALALGRLEEQSKQYRARRQGIEIEIAGLDFALRAVPIDGVLSAELEITPAVHAAIAARESLEASEYAACVATDALVQLRQAHALHSAHTKRLEERRCAYLVEQRDIETERAAIAAEGLRLAQLAEAAKAAPTHTALLAAQVAVKRLTERQAELAMQAEETADDRRAQLDHCNGLREQRDHMFTSLKALTPIATALADVDLNLEMCRRCPLTQEAQPAVREVAALTAALAAKQTQIAEVEPLVMAGTKRAMEARAASLSGELAAKEAQRALRTIEMALASIPADLGAQVLAWQARDQAAAKRKAAAEIPEVQADPPPSLEEATAAQVAADRDITKCRIFLDQAVRAQIEAHLGLAAAREAEIKAAELRASRANLVLEAAALKLLEDGLGKAGLQAVYCDQAGPAIEALTNHLLHETFGPRFSIAFETRRLKQGKKISDPNGYAEVFDVRILDAWSNEERAQGSGGQTVWFDTAFRLALSIYVTQQTGKDLRTLCFDEPAGQLSSEFAPQFTAMLKAARVLGGFHHVFLVSHQREVWGACDGFWVFKDGSVSYVGDVEGVDAILER